MSKYRKKPVMIEAITFEELVEHGMSTSSVLVSGLPWSFDYQGHAITHENDDCYLIPTLEGTMRFERGDMLITGVAGEIYPCKPDIFAATYEPVEEPDHAAPCPDPLRPAPRPVGADHEGAPSQSTDVGGHRPARGRLQHHARGVRVFRRGAHRLHTDHRGAFMSTDTLVGIAQEIQAALGVGGPEGAAVYEILRARLLAAPEERGVEMCTFCGRQIGGPAVLWTICPDRCPTPPAPDRRAALSGLYLEAHRAGVEAAAEHLRRAGGYDGTARYVWTVRDELTAQAREHLADPAVWTDPGSALAQAMGVGSTGESSQVAPGGDRIPEDGGLASPARTAADVLAKIDAADAMVSDLCHGRQRWVMSVPADCARDPDLVIGDALHAARKLILARSTAGEREEGVVYIARCPVHGLHGARTECYECGGPVEQVPMRHVASSPAHDEARAAGLAEYERLKLAFSEATWSCAEWTADDDGDSYEDRSVRCGYAERALDAHVAALTLTAPEERGEGLESAVRENPLTGPLHPDTDAEIGFAHRTAAPAPAVVQGVEEGDAWRREYVQRIETLTDAIRDMATGSGPYSERHAARERAERALDEHVASRVLARPVAGSEERERQAHAMHDAVTGAPAVWTRLDTAEREEWAETADQYHAALRGQEAEGE